MAPLTGDSHAHLLAVLERGASKAGYAVEWREAMPGAQGFVEHEQRLIALSSALEPNGQVAVLVHELAHVMAPGIATSDGLAPRSSPRRRPTSPCPPRASTRARKRFPT